MAATRKPLVDSGAGPSTQPGLISSADIYAPYYAAPFPPVSPNNASRFNDYFQTSSILRGGTILHKGFYDLLSMIPTPASASRFWTSLAPDPVAGPRYEDQNVRPQSRLFKAGPTASPRRYDNPLVAGAASPPA
jgi:hypothetical protein